MAKTSNIRSDNYDFRFCWQPWVTGDARLMQVDFHSWLINKSEEYIFVLVIWNRSEINIRIFLLKEVDSIIHTHLFHA
jgi:hypothetical protein